MKISSTIKFIISIMLLICSNARRSLYSSHNSAKKRSHSQAETKIDARNKSKFPEATSLTKSERGSVFSLVDLTVKCFDKNGPLTKFHLYGKFGLFSNDIGYEFGCMNNIIRPKQEVAYTTFTSDFRANFANQANSPKLLNNLDVDCKDGFINSFQLKKSNIEVYYLASCMNLKQNLGSCESKTTNPTNVSWLGIFSDTVSNLDQVPLEAPTNKALVSFKLLVKDNKVFYEYKACEVDTSVPIMLTAKKTPGRNVDNLNFKIDKRRRRF